MASIISYTKAAIDAALALKSAVGHSHVMADVTDLAAALAGKAAASHQHAAGDITSGVLGTARLGSGTADSTKFLRGDGSWQVPAGGGKNPGYLERSHMPAGNWFRPPFMNKDGVLSVVGELYFMPIFGSADNETQTVDKIRVKIEAAGHADSLVRIGLYNSDSSTWKPTGTPLVSTSASTSTNDQKEVTFTAQTIPNGRPLYAAFLLTGTTIATMSKMGYPSGIYSTGWYGSDSNAAGEPAYAANAVIPHAWKVTGQTSLGDVTSATFANINAGPFFGVRMV